MTPITQSWVDAVAAAIRQASDEHGRPNSFSCGELFAYQCAPKPLWTGFVGRHYVYDVWQRLGGSQKWGSCPVYADGRFYV